MKIAAFLFFAPVALVILSHFALAATITVCSSGCSSTTVQGGINSASNGDTVLITDSGTYIENVTVNKSITLTSNTTAMPLVNTTVARYGMQIISNSVTVSRLNLTAVIAGGSSSGVVTLTGNYTNITQNNIFNSGSSGGGNGIIVNSSNNVISNNNITTLNYGGGTVDLAFAFSNYPINNTVNNNNISYGSTSSYGIWIASPNTTIYQNSITSTGGYVPIFIDSYGISNYQGLNITNNSVNGLPIAYNVSISNTAISNMNNVYGEIIIANSTNVTISNSNFTQSGIEFVNTSNSTIQNNTMNTKTNAIVLTLISNFNSIIKNNITTSGNDRSYGIRVLNSNYANISFNNITTTGTGFDFGISLESVSNNATIASNVISSSIAQSTTSYSRNNGITLYSSNYTSIINTNVTTGGEGAVGLWIESPSCCNQINSSSFTTNGTGTTLSIPLSPDSVSGYLPSSVIFSSTSNNTISNSILNATNFYDVASAGLSNQVNYLLSDNYNKSDILINSTGNSKIFNQYYLNAQVKDGSGNPINSATVIGNDNPSISASDNPTNTFTVTTNSSGYIPQQILNEFVANGTYNNTQGYLYFTNYTINVTNTGYIGSIQQVNLTSNTTLSFNLLGNLAQLSAVSMNVYNKLVWWNDTVVVNGSLTYLNGSTNVSSLTANVTLNGIQYCTGTTSSNGFYSCNFTAPLEIGVYSLLVNITNSTGQSVTNTTSLSVKPNFGNSPAGSVDRSVFEVPVTIEDMDGTIRQIWTRVIIWRS